MRTRFLFLIVPTTIVALVAASDGATSPSSPAISNTADSIAVARVVKDFHAALSRGDSTRALGLLASDAVILESGGIESRAEYRSHHLPEDIAFAKTVTPIRGSLEIKVEGPSAWTTGTSSSKGRFHGRSINSIGAESMVLTKDAAGWRIRSIHWSSRSRPAVGD